MPYADWVNELPTAFFLVVHVAAFGVGAAFARVAFKRELGALGGGFAAYAVAELVYMTYHLDWTVFLFAHTIAEVLNLAAFVLVFAGTVHASVRRQALGATRSITSRPRSPPSPLSPPGETVTGLPASRRASSLAFSEHASNMINESFGPSVHCARSTRYPLGNT